MQKLAILLNAGLLCIISYMLYEKGMPHGDEMPLFMLLVVTPIINLITLLMPNKTSEKGLLALYFKRKKLEEAQRISQLEKNL